MQGRKRKEKIDHLHSTFGPLSTVVIVLGSMIGIGFDLIDQSEHATVYGVLKNSFELAVNVKSRGISFETVPHLGSY